jgi:hypothetical protein
MGSDSLQARAGARHFALGYASNTATCTSTRCSGPRSTTSGSRCSSAGSSIFGQGFDGLGVLLGQRFSMSKSDVDLFAWVLTYQYFTNGTTKMLTRDAGRLSTGRDRNGPGVVQQLEAGSGFSLDTELDVLAVPTGSITSPVRQVRRQPQLQLWSCGVLNSWSPCATSGSAISTQGSIATCTTSSMGRRAEHLGTLELGVYANIYRGHGLGVAASATIAALPTMTIQTCTMHSGRDKSTMSWSLR